MRCESRARSTAASRERAARTLRPGGDRYSWATPLETELKLRLPAGAARCCSCGGLRSAELLRSRTVQLDATYFDTAARLLQSHGMALRLRRVGRYWVQTLKAAAAVRGGLSTRPEWETPATLRQGVPRVDLARLRDTPLPALLARHRATRKLVPVFRTRFARTLWEDRLQVEPHRGRARSRPHRGAGRRKARRRADRRTRTRTEGQAAPKTSRARTAACRPWRAVARPRPAGPQQGRAWPLPRRRCIHRAPTKASARGFVDHLERDMSSGAALRAIMAHGLTVLLANTECLHEVHDPEFVHQARVALRRMRSALRLLDRRHEDFPESLAAELRWVGQTLGAARDWDVLVESTLPAWRPRQRRAPHPDAILCLGARRRRAHRHTARPSPRCRARASRALRSGCRRGR